MICQSLEQHIYRMKVIIFLYNIFIRDSSPGVERGQDLSQDSNGKAFGIMAMALWYIKQKNFKNIYIYLKTKKKPEKKLNVI